MKAYGTSGAWALFFIGALAGACNGLIGCGGGIFIVYALSYLCRGDPETEPKDIFATAVASILPMTAVSAAVYFASGTSVSSDGFYRYLVPAATGGVIGAILLDRINSRMLKRIFAVLVMWAGLSMILRRAGVM